MINIDELKFDEKGLIPAIVVDSVTKKVLTLAYMNRESLQISMEKGLTCFWSRSRQELWLKGDTSGNYQHIVSITADCDKDTILAKVSQVGAACHTGSRTCFFNEIVEKEYVEKNPLKVLESVYNDIVERKEHPVDGSYTNQMLDKGTDEILKMMSKECTEIIIATKNDILEHVKFEISDFLYYCMLLMVEKGVTWDQIAKELAQR